jgi:hypothetical protein
MNSFTKGLLIGVGIVAVRLGAYLTGAYIGSKSVKKDIREAMEQALKEKETEEKIQRMVNKYE